MGHFTVDATSRPGILRITLEGTIEPEEMRALVEAHKRAVDAYQGAEYRVFCDLTKLAPLKPESAEIFEHAKRYSGSRPNFRGSAVLVSSRTVGMQHRRTSTEAGVMDSELISLDPAEIEEHLAKVHRGVP